MIHPSKLKGGHIVIKTWKRVPFYEEGSSPRRPARQKKAKMIITEESGEVFRKIPLKNSRKFGKRNGGFRKQEGGRETPPLPMML